MKATLAAPMAQAEITDADYRFITYDFKSRKLFLVVQPLDASGNEVGRLRYVNLDATAIAALETWIANHTATPVGAELGVAVGSVG